MNYWIMVRRLRGPAFLILLGVLFLLGQLNVVSFTRSWPMLLILAGLLSLAERAALTQVDPVDLQGGQQGPYPPGAYPAGAYQTGTYPSGPYPAGNYPPTGYQGAPYSVPTASTGLVAVDPSAAVKSSSDDAQGGQ